MLIVSGSDPAGMNMTTTVSGATAVACTMGRSAGLSWAVVAVWPATSSVGFSFANGGISGAVAAKRPKNQFSLAKCFSSSIELGNLDISIGRFPNEFFLPRQTYDITKRN